MRSKLVWLSVYQSNCPGPVTNLISSISITLFILWRTHDIHHRNLHAIIPSLAGQPSVSPSFHGSISPSVRLFFCPPVPLFVFSFVLVSFCPSALTFV